MKGRCAIRLSHMPIPENTPKAQQGKVLAFPAHMGAEGLQRRLAKEPKVIDGSTIRQLTDWHADLHRGFAKRAIEFIDGMDYDLHFVSGDFPICTCGEQTGATGSGIEILSNAKTPVHVSPGNRAFLMKVQPFEAAGDWKKGSQQGDTSSGTGATRMGTRFNCPSKVTLHPLRSSHE